MNAKPPILVVLTPGFPHDEADTTCLPGIQRAVLALQQANPQVRLHVLAFEYPFKTKTYHWHGITVTPFCGRNRHRLYRLNNWQKVWRKLQELNSRYNITGILSFWFDECAFIGERFARRNNLTHYCWLQGQDARPGNRYVNWLKPDGERLIALSDFMVHGFERNYNVKIKYVIPLGFEPRTPALATVRDIDILGVGSLIPLKRYELFVEAIAYAARVKPDLKAVLCGKGPEQARLIKQINHLGLQNNITLAGELPNDEVMALMQQTRILLHPSEYEGFSVAITEALASGCHVVSFLQLMDNPLPHYHKVDNMNQLNHVICCLLLDDALEHHPATIQTPARMASEVLSLFGISSVQSLTISSAMHW